ncbi:MAG TPA: protein kinase, partial [Polyangiaceae bacterium]
MQVGRAENFHGSSRFDVLRQVGQGGVGSVYEAIDKESGTHVALKTLRTADPESILLLKNEFRSIQDLDHANLVTPRELFEADGQWFFSMEFVEGTDFLTYVRSSIAAERQARFEPTETLREESGEHLHTVLDSATGACDETKLRGVLRQLAIGVCALHAEHKVHRDLKPSNVLVDGSGQVRILDFGIVWDLSSAQRNTDDEGAVVGTVAFMAPEQAGGDAVTPAADWYAVGVMLYQALTGRLPFVGSVTNILTKKSTEAPPAPIVLDPTVPEDLSALAADLLKIEPSERPEGFEVLRRLGIASAGDVLQKTRAAGFVGRAHELAAMHTAFEDAGGGKAVTLLVEGESGVGKSWLVREFTSRVVADSHALVLRGRCYERESVPYKAVDSVIDDLAKFLASLRDAEAAALLPEEAPLLRQLFPVLETIPAVRAARITRFGVKSPQEARAQMFALLRTLLVNVALYRRLVLVIDDLQWADADSLALLSEVLRPPAAPPLLLLASIRSSTSTAQRGHRLHDALSGLPGDVRWVHLDPLPADDARALIRTLLANASGADVSPEAVNNIYAEAHGHPLFIDELVRHRALQEKKAPARLDDALFERATRLPAAARKLLELVTVAGVPLPQQIATKAAAMDFAQVYSAIGTLRAEHFVRTSGVYRHDTVEAYHDRIRHSMLAHLDEATKREWHGRLALALEQSDSFDPERLIAHWLGAGEKARAAGYAIRAADDAAAALAFDHAASQYQMALDLGAATGEEATALRVKMAEALANAGRGADAAHAYLEAAGDGTTNAAIDLRRRAAEQLFGVGHVAEGIKTIGSVLRAVGISWAEKPGAVILSIIFYSLLLAIRGLGFKPRREADIDPKALLRLDCLASAGTCGMTDHVRGRLFQVRTLYEALRIGEPARVGRAMSMYAAGYASAGEKAFAKTIDIGERVTRMGETRRDPALLGLAEVVAGFGYFLSGRFVESCAPFERGEVIMR